MAEYPSATKENFKGHSLADFLRHTFPETLEAIISEVSVPDAPEYIIEGSAGQSQWARCPWVAVFDPVVTDSAERGYYPVYLFREDMTGVYLSLNQGVTDVREQYRSKRKNALRARAADYRSRLGDHSDQFPEATIDLRPSSASNYSADYEAGNIIAKRYEAGAIPDEQLLRADLLQVLALYDELAYSAGVGTATGIEPEEQDNDLIENYAAFRYHRRIERSPALAKKVKDVHGHKCEACGFEFEIAFPRIAKNKYIEAHHLVPVSQLKGQRVSRNPKKDFAVLCSNCHRMIHRYPEPWNINGFRATLASAPK